MAAYTHRLTDPLPDRLATATQTIIEAAEEPEGSFRRYVEDERGRRAVAIIDEETAPPAVRLTVYTPEPPERVNYRVDVQYRGADDDLHQAGRLRDTEADAIDITYRDPATGGDTETTRRGPDAGAKTGELLGSQLSDLQSEAMEA